ncbi:MAG: hypothetical protein JXR59_07695 [Desulfuromonadaceae bacterium]|nr:hypothetical protein [Desulfuromonadaceae bacterium]
MKKLNAILVGLCLLLVSFVSVASAIEVSGDAYAGIYDKYLWRGYDLSGSMPVAQGGLDISAGSFTFSYWTNVQLANDSAEGYNSGEETETDIIIDYSRDINDLLSISVGNIFYGLDGIEDTNELYLTLSLNTILSPSLSVYWDWDEADEDGLYYTFSVGHDISITDALSLSLGALVSYNQSCDYSVGDYDDFHNYELSVGVDYAITEQISVGASFLFSEGLSNDGRDSIDSEMVSGVSVALNF